MQLDFLVCGMQLDLLVLVGTVGPQCTLLGYWVGLRAYSGTRVPVLRYRYPGHTLVPGYRVPTIPESVWYPGTQVPTRGTEVFLITGDMPPPA
eukprot:1496920-Rhodomonas_salina.1